MTKGRIYLLMAVALGSASAFAAKEHSIRFQNSIRAGYDDNVYQREDEEGSAFITDIVNITGKLTFSSRSDLLLYWQPEFRYRLDADPKDVMYQDLYGRYSHALSQRVYFQASDRFRYQDKDTGADTSLSRDNQNYLENDTMGSLDFVLGALTSLKIGAGYEFRTWEDKNYGKGTLNNDYDKIKGDASLSYELRPDTSTILVGVNYVDVGYEGNRGGYDSETIYGGIDQSLTPNLTGTLRLGGSYTTIDNPDSDTSDWSPYAQASLNFTPTARTTLTGALGYSMYHTDNSLYNAQDRFNLGIGLRHDLTGKISLSSSLGYTFSDYSSDYTSGQVVVDDAQENYVTFSVRASYQINRNNFVDAGYQFSDRSVDSDYLNEFSRNIFDIGWRLRL